MGQQFNGRLFTFVAAAVLAGCAANPPAPPAVSSAATPAAPAGSAAQPAAAAKGVRAANGYRKVVKNGTEYFCKRETMTGSRTESTEVCLTQAQLDKVQADSQDMVHRLQAVPGQSGGMDSNGGTSNTVMGR